MYTRQFPALPCPLSRSTARAGLLLALVTGLLACGEEPVTPSRTAPRPGTANPAVGSAEGRPNILVIMTDDQTVESMRVMPQTLSLIGATGVTFDHNIVTYSLCCPSRATFLTGQYPHNHGVRSNGPPDGGFGLLDKSNTLPLWLQAAGYVTGHIGKYLNGYGIVDSLEIPPGYTEWYASLGKSAYDYYNYFLNENGTVVPYGTNPEQYQADVYTDKAVDFINRRAPDAAVTPFFLFVTYLAPHWGHTIEPGDPSLPTPVPAPRHKGRFAGELLPVTPAFNEANVTDKPLSMRQRNSLTPTQVSEIGESYRQRLESLLAVDEGVVRIIEALQTQGVLQNTLIIFTSDNGFLQGEHRVPFGKLLPYEPSVKVPLIISGPGVVPGRVNSALVANIDLAPTIVEAAGATAGRTMDGRSLWPFLSGGQTIWPNGRRHVMVEYTQRGLSKFVFWSIKQGAYVYTEYANGDRELYDLRIDSAQVASRHADPAYANIRRRLATRLAAMKTCIGPTACW